MSERFWPKVNKSDGCWLWTRKRDDKGYGRFATGPGRYVFAHRMAWELTHGPIPEGMSVLHRCDNPPCCHPDHLFLGTQADNIADMVRKGRNSTGGKHADAVRPSIPRGESHPDAIITEAVVRAIRSEYTGVRGEIPRIAQKYGLSPKHVGKIVHRTIWAHVT